ncbi:DinB family protein [Ferruginibacter sp. HRS2-29]|uniref:DinB family protein n=1 Tax=Ferruginibacter sp. HRS2-29 TaxID=2487334 RepID=UPI0020CFB1F2|nr:DinB family protein [Ferruginibacter sp. HRS2-29]MCP9750332.1 DinB family protein [Ferruginibacter sp. HRS2-29]
MENIKQALETAIDGFIHELSTVPSADFNKIPFKDSWTAGQLAQHVALSDTGFGQMLTGGTKLTERPPDAYVGEIRNILMDFTTKLQSPGFIIPEERHYEKNELIGKLSEARASISNSIDTLDLTQTCTGFGLPQMGFITRLEAVYFVVYHTLRHTHQLKNIKSSLK